jgi:NitT/TauT family transport system ATP-binding protein
MAEGAAEQTLRTIISWGRYGEVFAYDDHRQVFTLENPT